MVALLLLLLPPQARAASFLDHWRAVCDDFRENYSYTEYKGLDWNAIFEANRVRFEGELTPAQFATNLHQSLLVLHDAHVAVQKPDGGWLGYSPPLPRNHPAQVATNHAAVPYADYQGIGAIVGARLTNGVVHIIVPTLETSVWDRISDAELPMNRRTDADADGANDAAEFTAATDPFDAASSLRLDITGPALTLSWTPASRRAFVIQAAGKAQAAHVQAAYSFATDCALWSR